MEESPRSFNSGMRVCCGCFALKGRSEVLKCAVCKVFVYCCKECQRVGWKELSHRKTCKPFTQVEPKERDLKLEDGEDLDRPYAFIVISQRGEPDMTFPSKAAFLACSSGSDEVAVVAKLKDNARLRADCEALAARFSWPSQTLGKSMVPGYCFEWDKTALYCFTDDNFQSQRELASDECRNPIASQLLMVDKHSRKVVRGNAVFVCLDDEDKVVKITRRDLLQISVITNELGGVGALSDRVHFENMRRASALAGLKKQNFQFHSVDMDGQT